jgi:hypothetical protein
MEPSDFLAAVDEELLCGICTNVLLEPKSCKEGHTFCDVCITTWLARKKSCPLDRKKLEKKDLTNVRIVANMIDKMEVRCANHAAGSGGSGSGGGSGGGSGSGGPPAKKQKGGKGKAKAQGSAPEGGCGWTGTVAERPAHLRDECDFTEVGCSFGVRRGTGPGTAMIGCQSLQPRHALEAHEAECKYRPVSCPHCDEAMQQKALTGHIKVCDEVEMACPRRCGERFLRGLRDEHAGECALSPVPCPFARHGCKKKLKRKDYADHQVEAAGAHAELTASGLGRLEDMIKSVRDDVKAELRAEIQGLEERVGELESEDVASLKERVKGLETCVESQLLTWKVEEMSKKDFSAGETLVSTTFELATASEGTFGFVLELSGSEWEKPGDLVQFRVTDSGAWYDGIFVRASGPSKSICTLGDEEDEDAEEHTVHNRNIRGRYLGLVLSNVQSRWSPITVGGSKFSIMRQAQPYGEFMTQTFPRESVIDKEGMGFGWRSFATFNHVFESYLTNDTLNIEAKIKLWVDRGLNLKTES